MADSEHDGHWQAACGVLHAPLAGYLPSRAPSRRRDEDVTDDLDLRGLRRSALEQRRVNVDFSSGMIESLNLDSRRVTWTGAFAPAVSLTRTDAPTSTSLPE